MKNKLYFILLSFLLFGINCIGQQIPVEGIISICNSKYETGQVIYVDKAQVEDDFGFAQATMSKINGEFTLIFIGLQEGANAKLVIKKDKLEVVNLSELKVEIGQKKIIQIYLSHPDKINDFRKKIYQVGKTQAEKNLEKKIFNLKNNIEELSHNTEKNKQKILLLEEELQVAYNNYSMIDEQAKQLARKYERLNLDVMEPIYSTAFRYFQSGSLDSALIILNSNIEKTFSNVIEERKKINNLLFEIAQRDSIQKRASQNLILLLELKIDVHINRFEADSIENCLKKILILDSINYNALSNYSTFLKKMNRVDESLYYAFKTLSHANSTDSLEILGQIGYLFFLKKEYDHAQLYFEEVIHSFDKISKPNKYQLYTLSDCYNALGVLFKTNNNFESALKNYNSALKIRSDLAKVDSSDLVLKALTLHDLGSYYIEKRDSVLAEQYLKEALQIFEYFGKIDWVLNAENIIMTQATIGRYYTRFEKYNEAIKEYEKALRCVENLEKIVSLGILVNQKLGILNNLGTLYLINDDLENGEKCLLKGYEIANSLVNFDSLRYRAEMANIKHNLVQLYLYQAEFEKMELAFRESTTLHIGLAKDNPIRFKVEVARDVIQYCLYLLAFTQNNPSPELKDHLIYLLEMGQYNVDFYEIGQNYDADMLRNGIKNMLTDLKK